MIFDPTPCTLGEGPIWHPDQAALFWFDIVNRTLYRRGLTDPAATAWTFPQMVSAAGIVDDRRLLVASATALLLFDSITGESQTLCPLEADDPVTRSNDGRADPQGGFWIGTMGRNAEVGAGSIWRWYRGELRRLYPGVTISNAICFAPDGGHALWCDTAERIIRRVRLDADGWPAGEAAPFVDLRAEGLNPDGAVIDAEGGLWSAQWGAGRVARYDSHGRLTDAIAVPARHASCPAFGGPDRRTLFVTTARQGLDDPGPADGAVHARSAPVAGQAEHRVILD